MSDFCAFCGKELPANIRQVRHRTQDDTRPITCDRLCEVERRKRDGMFKAMSKAGKEARSTAVARSNHINPRRKKSDCPTRGRKEKTMTVRFIQFKVGYRNYDDPRYPNGVADVIVVDASSPIEALNRAYDILVASPNGHPKSISNIAEPVLETAIEE